MRKFYRSNIRATALLSAVLMATAAGSNTASGAEPAATGWSGVYFGANAGYIWSSQSASYIPNDPASASISGGANGTLLSNSDVDYRGGFGGFQIGSNWHVHPRWIYGIEADFQLGDIAGTGASSNLVGGPIAGTATASSDSKWFGTLRARLGFLTTNELQLFATGGLAFGRVDLDTSYTVNTGPLGIALGGFGFLCAGGVPCFVGSSSSVQTGWTVGGGAEWRISDNFSVKTEYLYVNLGSRSVRMTAVQPFGGGALSSFRVKFDDADSHLIRIGLNYRFNSGMQ